MKRAFDIVAVAITSPVWLSVLFIVGILVRMKLGRPIFFRQHRPGLNGEIFEIVKFRTMLDSRDAADALLPDANRLTSFGRWLRSTSLDELPELWNVLRGDMSLVGPRPLLVEYLGRYSPRQARRHEVRPGLTGLAQVMGRNALTWEEKFEWDVRYVDTRGFWLDVAILARTVKAVLSRQNVNARGGAIMPEFKPDRSDHAE